MVPTTRPEEGGNTNDPALPTTPPQTGDRRRFSILIADDDKGTRETLGEMLAARGFRTVLAADGNGRQSHTSRLDQSDVRAVQGNS